MFIARSALVGLMALVVPLGSPAVAKPSALELDSGPTAWTLGLTGVDTESGLHSSTSIVATWRCNKSDERATIEVHDDWGRFVYAAVITGTSGTMVLDELWSDTGYRVVLSPAISVDGHGSHEILAEASIRTPPEMWQVMGPDDADSVEECTIIMPDSSVLAWPMHYPDESYIPEMLRGHVRLYYKLKPLVGDGKFLSIAMSSIPWDGTDASLMTYDSISQPGLIDPPEPTALVERGAAFQVVPLHSDVGFGVRAYFEARGADNVVRFMSLDNHDGFLGQDFHPGPPVTVETVEDWEVSALPDLVIDAGSGADTGMLMARQSKIGWPTLDTWRWDGSAGSFMVITGRDACGQTGDGLFYAVYDGLSWSMDRDDDGCPRPLVISAHGPAIQHLGDLRYKLYFENRSFTDTGKPLHLLYADGAEGEDPTAVEFEDWDPESMAREVHFLWPDGTMVSEAYEPHFGDHAILCPGGTLDVQYMYINLGGNDGPGGGGSRGLGLARLLNP